MSASEIAIRVEGLGKMYRLGRQRPHASTLSGKIRNAVTSPFQWLSEQMREPTEEEVLWALKDVSFEVKRGEVVGFIGHNGAGKSTLLKLLSRITEPTTGYAEIHGRIAALLEVGTGMHPELTGRENIYMNGTVLGMKKREIDTKFDEIVDFSGIAKFLDTPVKRYSSGMRVRLGFAIAAHLEPEILVIDEVLAVGDADFQAKCLRKMEDVACGGRTVLFVSHNMAAIENLCSSAILLDAGQLLGSGSCNQIISHYMQARTLHNYKKFSDRLDRKGDGRVRIISLSFVNQDGQNVERLASGDHLAIVIEYESTSADNLDKLDVRVTFFSDKGLFLFTCSNVNSGAIFCDLPSKGEFRCEIKKFPLAPGHYTYNLYSEISGQTTDWIKDAGCIEVFKGDFFSSGRLFNHCRGFKDCLLVEQTWSLVR